MIFEKRLEGRAIGCQGQSWIWRHEPVGAPETSMARMEQRGKRQQGWQRGVGWGVTLAFKLQL